MDRLLYVAMTGANERGIADSGIIADARETLAAKIRIGLDKLVLDLIRPLESLTRLAVVAALGQDAPEVH